MVKPEKRPIGERKPCKPSESLIGGTVAERRAALIANRALLDMRKRGQ